MNEIMTWRERIGVGTDFPLHAPTDVERAMEAEIAELRAAHVQPTGCGGTGEFIGGMPCLGCDVCPSHDAGAGLVDSEGGHHD